VLKIPGNSSQIIDFIYLNRFCIGTAGQGRWTGDRLRIGNKTRFLSLEKGNPDLK
jgi:hypothetical protein